MPWAISEAVKQLVEYLNSLINSPDEFLAFTVKITRQIDGLGFETWKVAAYDVNDKPFKYAWYIDGSNIVADGY